MSELKPSEAIEILESIYPSKKQIVTGEYPDVAEALDLAINTLRRAQPTNEPLTLNQLREMDGEPVYCVYPGCSTGGEWFLVNSQGAYKNGGFLSFRYYGEWLAYRRKPERSENE